MTPECSTNGDPLLATLVPLSGICSKVSVTLGIWLVFVFVWTEVDTQISTYAPTYVTLQGLGAQLCVALFGDTLSDLQAVGCLPLEREDHSRSCTGKRKIYSLYFGKEESYLGDRESVLSTDLSPPCG